MKTLALALATSAAALVTLGAARPAHALGPIDLEIAAKGGYGSTDLGPGFGGRAGVAFFGLYGGVSAIDYLGKSVSVLGTSVTEHTLLLGGEVGYGFKISVVTIRPLVGFGDAMGSFNIPGLPSASSFYLEPGGLIQLNFGLLIFGVDAGCLILTSAGQDSTGGSSVSEAFTIHGQIGVKF